MTLFSNWKRFLHNLLQRLTGTPSPRPVLRLVRADRRNPDRRSGIDPRDIHLA